jgi:hypothetical protein
MFWTYFLMLTFLGIGSGIAKASGEMWDSGDGFVAFVLAGITFVIGLAIIVAVIVWADSINIISNFVA